MPRFERPVRDGATALTSRISRRHPLLRVDDRSGQSLVVQQRRLAVEPLDAHQLFGVQATVRTAKLGVSFVWDLPDCAVVRHQQAPGPVSDNRTQLSYTRDLAVASRACQPARSRPGCAP